MARPKNKDVRRELPPADLDDMIFQMNPPREKVNRRDKGDRLDRGPVHLPPPRRLKGGKPVKD